MNQSIADAALKTVFSAEADEYRRESRHWFIRSQIFMLLAASPLVLSLIGSFLSFFSGSDYSLAWAGFSFFSGVLVTLVSMIVFCPFAFYCIHRSYKAGKLVETLVADSLKPNQGDLAVDPAPAPAPALPLVPAFVTDFIAAYSRSFTAAQNIKDLWHRG